MLRQSFFMLLVARAHVLASQGLEFRDHLDDIQNVVGQLANAGGSNWWSGVIRGSELRWVFGGQWGKAGGIVRGLRACLRDGCIAD